MLARCKLRQNNIGCKASNPLCTPVKFSASKIIAATVGLVAPRYRTLGQWCGTYRQILAGRPISEKTRANRASALGHIERALGDRPVGAIRPHEVARLVQQLAASTPQCAKRVLFEAREAVMPAPAHGLPVSLHEIRSLSERLYREQGIDPRPCSATSARP